MDAGKGRELGAEALPATAKPLFLYLWPAYKKTNC